ncbi:MAG: hypothetical protein WBG08_10050 [Litorimonas sp.]
MRFAVLAVSAAALTGCSWLGGSYSTPKYAQQVGCAPVATGGYAHAGYGHAGYGQAGYGYAQGPCGPVGYGLQSGATGFAGVTGYNGGVGAGAGATPGFVNYAQGYGAQGYAAQGYAAQGYAGGQMAAAPAMAGQGFAAQGFAGQGFASQGVAGQGFAAQGYAAQGATTLGGSAPFGSALSMQSAGGTFAAPGVQTVVGAPIYVPQPYASPYPVPLPANSPCCGGGSVNVGGAMPFGVEVFGGTEFDTGGKIFTKKSEGPPDGDYTIGIRVGSIDEIGYDDAFGQTKTLGGALTYDLSPSLTAIGSVSASRAEGQTVEDYTTVETGSWTNQVFTPDAGTAPRALDGTFSDLETTTIEAGLRQYYGHPLGLRPYLGVSAGIAHNNEVEFVQTYADTGAVYGSRTFVESGWSPTAAATLGAEIPVGPRAALGVETGIRWRDNMQTAAPSEDRVTIPVALRGRLSF